MSSSGWDLCVELYRHKVTFRAADEGSLPNVDGAVLRRLLERDERLALQMMNHVARALWEGLQATRLRLAALALENAYFTSAGGSPIDSAVLAALWRLQPVGLEKIRLRQELPGRPVADGPSLIKDDRPREDLCDQSYVVGRGEHGLRKLL